MVFFRKADNSRTIVYKSVRLNLPVGRRETASSSSMQNKQNDEQRWHTKRKFHEILFGGLREVVD